MNIREILIVILVVIGASCANSSVTKSGIAEEEVRTGDCLELIALKNNPESVSKQKYSETGFSELDIDQCLESEIETILKPVKNLDEFGIQQSRADELRMLGLQAAQRRIVRLVPLLVENVNATNGTVGTSKSHYPLHDPIVTFGDDALPWLAKKHANTDAYQQSLIETILDDIGTAKSKRLLTRLMQDKENNIIWDGVTYTLYLSRALDLPICTACAAEGGTINLGPVLLTGTYSSTNSTDLTDEQLNSDISKTSIIGLTVNVGGVKTDIDVSVTQSRTNGIYADPVIDYKVLSPPK